MRRKTRRNHYLFALWTRNESLVTFKILLFSFYCPLGGVITIGRYGDHAGIVEVPCYFRCAHVLLITHLAKTLLVKSSQAGLVYHAVAGNRGVTDGTFQVFVVQDTSD